MVGDLIWFPDRVGCNGDASAWVRLDDVDGVVALDEGQAVPKEGFLLRDGGRLGLLGGRMTPLHERRSGRRASICGLRFHHWGAGFRLLYPASHILLALQDQCPKGGLRYRSGAWWQFSQRP